MKYNATVTLIINQANETQEHQIPYYDLAENELIALINLTVNKSYGSVLVSSASLPKQQQE